MAALVKDATGGNDAARIALHTIVSGALASAQGANPGAAAAGGFVAAASSDALALAFYGKPASELVGDEKMLISNLVTILGAAAGGIAGGDGVSIASGGNAARVEVENNSLGDTELVDLNVCLLTGSETACARANKTPEQYATGVAVTIVTIGGIAIVGAAPEVIAAARVAMEGCKANLAYCLNQAGILTAEVVVPGGSGAGGALVIGRTAQEIAVINNAAHNAASFSRLKMDLKTTQAANEVVESLRNTGKLPSQYVIKQVAEDNGWVAGKALNNYVPGGQIGGDVFENTTHILPSAQNRVWYEADVGLVNTMSRAKQDGTRLLYSNDGLLYITTDHYKTVAPIGTWK